MKKLIVLFTSLVLAVSLSGCSTSEDTVKLGMIGPLTGDYSVYGVSVQEGAQLAVDEINAAGGVLDKDLELIAYDSKGDSVEGVNAYNRLRDEDEIDALIGGTFSGVTLAIKPLAVEDGMPVFTPTATHPDITTDADNVFRAAYTDSYQATVLAQFAKEDLEVTKVAVLYNRDDAYSEGLATAFIEEFGTDGVVSNQSFGAQDDDYSAVLNNILSSGAEAVFLPGYVAEVGAILTQAADKGITIPFIGGDGWDSIESQYAEVAEGNYFGNHYAKTDDREIVQDFVTNYTAEYGSAPNALAALAYDTVYAMADTFERAGTVDSEAVITALAALEYTGVTGDIHFDDEGNAASKSVTIIQVVDGEHSIVSKKEQE